MKFIIKLIIFILADIAIVTLLLTGFGAAFPLSEEKPTETTVETEQPSDAPDGSDETNSANDETTVPTDTENISYELSGKWLIDKGVSSDGFSEIFADETFYCYGVETSIAYTYDNGILSFFAIRDGVVSLVVLNGSENIFEAAFAVVDFGSEPQQFSEAFYTWFTANAEAIE